MRPFLRTLILVSAAGFGLSACSYDRYGYGGLSIGYGNSGYYDPWYGGHYGYSSYSSYPYWGWHDGFYYPGSGIYIYDSFRRPFLWSDRHRRFWTGRRDFWRGRLGRAEFRDNWRDFRRERRDDRRAFRVERRDDRQALRSGQIGREAFRQDRRMDRREFRQDRRQDRREFRREIRREFRSRRRD